MWVKAKLQLAGLDSRIIGLLKAIEQTGSLNQAAKQVGLSYKGAWQVLERANNSAPQLLVSAATGGSKGGGSCLTEAGQRLLCLFTELEQQHQAFIAQLNRNLEDDLDIVLLMQRLIIKTSARNQLFGKVTQIRLGAVNAKISVQLKGGETITTTTDLQLLNELALKVGSDAVLLIDSADIALVFDAEAKQFSAQNHLACYVLNIQKNAAVVEVTTLLPSGETLIATITEQGLAQLNLCVASTVLAVFNSNVPYLGIQMKNS